MTRRRKNKKDNIIDKIPPLFYNRYHRLKIENNIMYFSIYNDETKKWDKWLTTDEFIQLTMPDLYNEKYKTTAV